MRRVHLSLLKAVAMLCAVIAIQSCSTNKTNLTYFQDLTALDAAEIQTAVSTYVIQPEDELQINVSSSEPTVAAPYNAPLYTRSSNMTELNVQPVIDTYIVDKDGNINMPVLGKVHVAGLTEAEVSEKLLGLLDKDLIDPFVTVKLINFRVRVLGEVRTPGFRTKSVGRSTMTVLDAVASAGDMTEYSDRSNVMVIRNENGKLVYHRLNLNESSSLTSPYYYLQQNDIVIVPPSKSRESNANYDSGNAFKIQVVSTIVSVVSVIASLVIALIVK
ncbi:MAG: polysaccharide biosynthesis/export family protein [Clostridium sp.]|nr:polysaccharide biosynthesis/export family protein [Clostridium sp.]